MNKKEQSKMASQIETVRKYIEDQRNVVVKQHEIIAKYDRLVRMLAFALETETGMASTEWIDWAKSKISEIDGETA